MQWAINPTNFPILDILNQIKTPKSNPLPKMAVAGEQSYKLMFKEPTKKKYWSVNLLKSAHKWKILISNDP